MAFYWKCCGNECAASSWDEARTLLEKHEKEKHSGKPIGAYGCKTEEN